MGPTKIHTLSDKKLTTEIIDLKSNYLTNNLTI